MRPRKPDGNWPNQACRILVQLRSGLRLRNSCPQPPVPLTQYMTPSRVEPPPAGAPSSVTERQTAPSPVANRSCQMGRSFPGLGASKRTTSSPVTRSDCEERGDRSAAGLSYVHLYRATVPPNAEPASRLNSTTSQCRGDPDMPSGPTPSSLSG